MRKNWEAAFLSDLRTTGDKKASMRSAGIGIDAVRNRLAFSSFKTACDCAIAEAADPTEEAKAATDAAIFDVNNEERPKRGRPAGRVHSAIGPSPLQEKLAAETDFSQACALVAQAFRSITGTMERESAAHPEVAFNPGFWREQTRRADRARAAYLRVMGHARQVAIVWYRADGLHEYAEALQTGNFAELGL